jgi:hypothetical protein
MIEIIGRRSSWYSCYVFGVCGLAVCLLISCGGGGGGNSNPSPPSSPTVSVTASPTTITKGQSTKITVSSTNATSCTESGSWSGSVACNGSATVTPTNTGTFTYTVTATGDGGTASASATVTVNAATRTITIKMDLPNYEISLFFGGFAKDIPTTCSGCVSSDTVHEQFFGYPGDPEVDQSLSTVPDPTNWPGTENFTGYGYVPQPIKIWVTGTDGATSNTIWFTFDGNQNEAVQNPSTGEVYYYSSGNGSDGSGAILKFKSDGTPDGSYTFGTGSGASTIATDGQSIFRTEPAVLSSGVNGIGVVKTSDGSAEPFIYLTNGEPLAIDAKGGTVCATIPTGNDSPNTVDAVDCNNSGGTFTLPGIPAGSQPVAIKFIDSSTLLVYGSGDRTLRRYTISGTTGTAAGTYQFQNFTATDTNYWTAHPWTAGSDIAVVGSMIGVTGQVVNNDGTIDQQIALVNNGTTMTLAQYVTDLPGSNGKIHIAADQTNNAITAEYLDVSGKQPVMMLERIYVTAPWNVVLLQSSSSITPGAGFLTTQDGQNVFTCGMGNCQANPNN